MSEFSRPYQLAVLGTAPQAVAIEADTAERAALAARFGLVWIGRLTARAELVRDGETVRAAGTMEAAVTQACVATGVEVPAELSAPFDLRFEPAGNEADAGEVELDEAALDVVPYAGGAIDLGEAVAQTLALTLDPWPRAPDADTALRSAGVLQEGEEREPSPFAKLKGLLKQ